MKTKSYPNNLRASFGAFIGKKHLRQQNHSRIAIFSLILVLCLVAIPSPAFAQEQAGNNQHVLKFYFDPVLVPEMIFAKTVLPKYVEDLNAILAKNTSRRLAFNPDIDIIITTSQPFSDQATAPLPVDGFEIWTYIVQSRYSYSYGGYAGVDTSGAAALAGMKWVKLYDPDKLSPDELKDYWTQINNILHELAHVFGAGMGEYYKLSNIQDTTNVTPFLNIDVLDPHDSFWSDKPDFMADPLLRNAAKTEGLERLSNRKALLGFVKYSDLTATIISGNFRNSAPMIDFQHISINVTNESGMPLSNANIKIWSVVGYAPYQTRLMVDALTDLNGQATFSWGGSINPHNNYDFLRLIKVYKDEYISSAKYISIYDTDIVKLIHGTNMVNISISLKTANTPPTLVSIVCPYPNHTNAASVDFTVTFSESVTGVDISDFMLEKIGVRGASVNSVSGSGSVYTVTANKGSGTGTIRLGMIDNDTIVDSNLIPLGGVGTDNGTYINNDTYDVSLYNLYLPLISKN